MVRWRIFAMQGLNTAAIVEACTVRRCIRRMYGQSIPQHCVHPYIRLTAAADMRRPVLLSLSSFSPGLV